MEVSRGVLVPAGEDYTPFAVATTYTGRTRVHLIQEYGALVSSDASSTFHRRESEDNGRTWSAPRAVFEPVKAEKGVFRRAEPCFLLDGDVLIHFFDYILYPEGKYTGDAARHTRVFLSISRDGGKTFSEPAQLIQNGFDEIHWAKDTAYGTNSAILSFCAPFTLRDGRIILPAAWIPPDSDFVNWRTICEQALVFTGEWLGDHLVWEMGGRVAIAPDVSSRGLCEPQVAELRDGSLLMICRGSNEAVPDVAGRKWCCTSTDGGNNWSEVAALRYDTGESLFSPATGGRLIRHSGTGRLFWIGNITDENPQGNGPRYPVQIAEVDETRPALIKDSVTVIDTKGPEDSPALQLSNFKVYEDRESGEIVMVMARWFAEGSDQWAAPAQEYRIRIP